MNRRPHQPVNPASDPSGGLSPYPGSTHHDQVISAAGHGLIWYPRADQAWHAARCWTLGIVNVTPDSFSDGGELATPDAAAAAARAMMQSGVDGVDIGGESTRPGAEPVDAAEQIRRVIPAIAAIRRACGNLLISIDTTRAEVAAAAIDAGADVINDVSGGTDDSNMFALAAHRDVGLILMHRHRPPRADVASTQYGSGNGEPAPVAGSATTVVKAALSQMLAQAAAAGVNPQRVLLDPGLGFGKTVAQNSELIQSTPELLGLGHPVLSALSRKSFVGALSGLPPSSPPKARAAGTLALSVLHALRGARVFRVHEVDMTRQALAAALNVALAPSPHAR